jgi:hypothetical protein
VGRDLQPVRLLMPDVPPEFDRLLRHALETDRERRTIDANDISATGQPGPTARETP